MPTSIATRGWYACVSPDDQKPVPSAQRSGYAVAKTEPAIFPNQQFRQKIYVRIYFRPPWPIDFIRVDCNFRLRHLRRKTIVSDTQTSDLTVETSILKQVERDPLRARSAAGMMPSTGSQIELCSTIMSGDFVHSANHRVSK